MIEAETWNSTPSRSLNYSYDASDRLTGILDSEPLALDFEYTYDSRSQLQAERQLGSTYLLGKSINFDRKFDAVGRELKLEANIGGTVSVSPTDITFTGGVWDFRNNYAFDNRDRLVSVTQSNWIGANAVAPKYVGMTYNSASDLTDVYRFSTLTPGASQPAEQEVRTRNSFDGAGRLKSITHSKSAIATGVNWDGTSAAPTVDTVAAYFLNYNNGNQITDLASRADGFKSTYLYDVRNQLTNAASTQIAGLATPFAPPSETYGTDMNGNFGLDANGNRKSSTNGASQSTPGTHNRLQTDGTYNYLYDNEGNVTKRTKIIGGTVTDYTWDHRNRLATVTTNDTGTKKTEYTYDAFDRRTAKRVDIDGNGTWDRYEVYSWADGQEVMRWVDSDGQVATQTLKLANRYLWSDAVDQLLSDEQYLNNTGFDITTASVSAVAGNTLWALNDNQGSVRDLIDNNGIIRQHLVFDSFGKRIREVDYNTAGTVIASNNAAAIDTVFGYTGRDWDTDIGMQYNRARWYDPSTGRWLSQDPIGFAGGDANLYRYVGNSPTNATDPSGLDWWEANDLRGGDRDWKSFGGWNPLGWSLTQEPIFQLSGGWNAATRSNELERKRREMIRLRSQAPGWDGNVQTVLNSYKASQCEIDGMKSYAEAAVNYNAAAFGGAFLSPARAGIDPSKFSDDVLYRTQRGDNKGRPYGTPRNPSVPPLDVFKPRIADVNAHDLPTLISGKMHGLHPDQQKRMLGLSNDDLLMFRYDDPISGVLTKEGFSITGGHHRLSEIQRRVDCGSIPKGTKVRVLIHD